MIAQEERQAASSSLGYCHRLDPKYKSYRFIKVRSLKRLELCRCDHDFERDDKKKLMLLGKMRQGQLMRALALHMGEGRSGSESADGR